MEILHILYLLGIAIALLAALGYNLRYLRSLWREMIKPPSSRPIPLRSQNKLGGKVSHSYQTVRGSRQLQNQLLTLLHGDTATAKRLLNRQQQRHPGKSDNWYLEKAIYDLERDRRC